MHASKMLVGPLVEVPRAPHRKIKYCMSSQLTDLDLGWVKGKGGDVLVDLIWIDVKQIRGLRAHITKTSVS